MLAMLAELARCVFMEAFLVSFYASLPAIAVDCNRLPSIAICLLCPLPSIAVSSTSKYFVPGTWYQVPGTKHLVLSTWYQVLGTKYLLVLDTAIEGNGHGKETAIDGNR